MKKIKVKAKISDDLYNVCEGELLYSKKTPFQDVKVLKTKTYGKVLVIDGVVQMLSSSESFYHEIQVHIPMLLSQSVKNVLLLGGGVGCALRDILKYPVERVDVVEMDKEIIEIGKKYFSGITNNSLNDKRAKIIIGDGRNFIENCETKYDVIIVDVTDPYGQSARLFTKEFYDLAFNALKRKGILCTQAFVPFFNPKIMATINNTVLKIFDKTLLAFVPYFDAGGFVIALKNINLKKEMEKVSSKLTDYSIKTQLIDPNMLKLVTIVPKYMQKELAKWKGQMATDNSPLTI